MTIEVNGRLDDRRSVDSSCPVRSRRTPAPELRANRSRGKNARRHCGSSSRRRRVGQFQLGMSGHRAADGGAPCDHLDRRLRIGECKNVLVGAMKSLRPEHRRRRRRTGDPARSQRLSPRPDAGTSPRPENRCGRRRAAALRGVGKRQRLPAQLGDHRRGAVPIELRRAGDEHAAIFPRNVGHHRAECAECRAHLGDDRAARSRAFPRSSAH